jgi:DNA-binding HxlR family transcriptional regulator
MAALDLLGRRWTLRVLWELRDGKPATFRDLRDRCDQMSTSVLNQRLTELREAALLEHSTAGYRLTKQGAELQKALAPLDAWAKHWKAPPAGGGTREEIRRTALSRVPPPEWGAGKD